MKKFILPLLILAFFFQTYTVSAAQVCDQVFYGKLRSGLAYNFWDDLTNTTGNPVFVNQVATTFAPAYAYGPNPTFNESAFVTGGHIWSPGETGRLVTSTSYPISGYPPVRSTSNLVITYDVTYSQQVSGVWGAGTVHRECKNYEVTWCGDGIVDATDGETCDAGTQNGQVGYCNATCTGVVAPPPYNLSLKKYVLDSQGTYQDAQNLATAVNKRLGDTVMYKITVKNEGPNVSNGPTRVSDSLPYEIEAQRIISAEGWSCTLDQPYHFYCDTNASVASGANYADIILEAKVTSNSPTEPVAVNWAYVYNDGQTSLLDDRDPAYVVIVPTTLPPACSSTVSGALLAPITAGVCNSGNPINFVATGTNPINYSWNCTNGTTTTPVCRASYTFIGPPAPSCNSITVSPTSGNIPLRSSVSCSTTNATTVSIACGNGQIINNGTGSCLYANTGIFTPTCTVNGTITNPACQGTVTATNPVAGSPILSIKKFANNADGQTISDALPLTPGASFTYRYVVSNSGTVAATGVVVTDTFPQYVTVGTIVPPSGWTCNKGTKTLTGVTYPTVICTTPSLAANTSVTITINEVLSLTTPLNTQIRNIVFVCKNGDTTIPNCSSTCIDPANPACTPPPPPPNCDPIPGSPNYDPACVITPPSSGAFDLRLKKYVNGNDTSITITPTSSGGTPGPVPESPEFVQPLSLASFPGVTLTVGPGKTYSTLSAAILAASSGDKIRVDQGEYVSDYSVIGNKRLAIIGLGAGATLRKSAPIPNGKAILVSSADLYIENMIFTDVDVADANGAGIRYEGGILTITGSTFRNNEDGILTIGGLPAGEGKVWVGSSKFIGNGKNATGLTHGLYIGGINFFLIRDSIVSGTRQGHHIKSRALNTIILNNTLDDNGSDTSYNIDLPNGGRGYVYGNTIIQSATSPNRLMVAYSAEQSPPNPGILTLENNIFQSTGGGSVGIRNFGTNTVISRNNTFQGVETRYQGTVTEQTGSGSTGSGSTGSTTTPVTYTFIIDNLGPGTATGTTTVTDTFPAGVTPISVSGTGWTCSLVGQSYTCTRSDILTSGSAYPTITAQAVVTNTAGTYRNYACLSNPGDPHEGAVLNPDAGLYKVNNCDPATVIVTGGTTPGFPTCTSITPSVASPVSPSTSVTYTCAPPTAFTGTVSNIEYRIQCAPGDPTAVWGTGTTRICLAPTTESTSQTITCAVRDRTNSGSIFTGSDIGACRTTMSTTGGGGPGGPTQYFVPRCSAGIRSCGTVFYNSLPGCIASEGATCYTSITDCNTNNTLSCSGPGGGGCTNPLGCCTGAGCGGGGGSAYCGNGILEPFRGETCDLGNLNGQLGSSCDANCKTFLTNPGANPILDIWMKIPTLSRTMGLGFSWLDGIDGKIRVAENQVVVGQNGNVFSIADQIFFGIRTQYQIPLLIPASHNVCIYSDNLNAVKQDAAGPSGEFCRPLGGIARDYQRMINDDEYVVVGKGVYIACVTMTSTGCVQYGEFTANPGKSKEAASEIPLFKGNELLNASTSLRDAFQGNISGQNGNIRLTIANPSLRKNDRPIDIGLPVRVSSTMVASTTTTTNRLVSALDPFNAELLLNNFLLGLKRSTTITNRTMTSSSTSAVTSRITVNGNTRASDISVSSLDGLIALKTNGNENVLSLSGRNLTIEGCANDTISLSGVRTLIVEGGNLVIKCNLVYADANASWAFIVKNGNIAIYGGNPAVAASFGVTNIVGVFVDIGGSFQPFPAATTSQKILKIEGSLYGNATPLFDSRLYVRGTSAYEIITAGVNLNYSNRALVNPPPLLSNYLGNYNVERVVR